MSFLNYNKLEEKATMNKIIITLCALALLVNSTKGQDTLYIHQKAGIAKIAIINIDSMKFEASAPIVATNTDTLYIHQKGNGIAKIAVNSIDSLKFERTPVDTVVQSAVQKLLVNTLLKTLGLASVSTSDIVSANSVIRKGDVVEFGYHDVYNDSKISMKINEAESIKNEMVYYGTETYLDDGTKIDLRYKISESYNKLIEKKEVKINGSYSSRQTYEFVSNEDKSVTQNQIMNDGSKAFVYNYLSNSPLSVFRVVNDGYKQVLDDISIVRK